MEETNRFYPHLSVDCVLLGFDGEDLKVLLVRRKDATPDSEQYNDMKLPGRLLYEDEELDEAAHAVLQEYTGIKEPYLRQFKSFGSVKRTSNPKDVKWLENSAKLKIGRLVTVAYMSLIRITGKIHQLSPNYQASWLSLTELPELAFDHNQIIREAQTEVQRQAKIDPGILFELLPSKFTALQFRKLYELVYNRPQDVRNFHKKILAMPYVVALEERESGVSHRAARYYRFDKKRYVKG